MHISWLGTSAFKIQAKPFSDDIVVLIDPYKPEEGSFPRSLTANITLYTRGTEGSITISGEPFSITTPGEYEVKGVLVTAVPSGDDATVCLRIDAEGVSIGHVGLTNNITSETAIDALSGVDILCIPVGGKPGFETEEAIKIVNSIEPRIVIPMAYKSDNDPKALPVTDFLKGMGVGTQAPEKKIIVKKKDLPQDETKVIVLEKE